VKTTSIVVGYVAFVSSAALGWQIWIEHQKKRRRDRLRKPFASVSLRSQSSAAEAQKRDDFYIDIDNLGGDDLQIIEFGIAVSGGREVIKYYWRASERLSIPVIAAAHSPVSVPVPSRVADGAFSAPFAVLAIAWVKLSTGARIYGQWIIVHPITKSDNQPKPNDVKRHIVE